MKSRRTILAAAIFALPASVSALELGMPSNARQTMQKVEALGSLQLPVSGWRNGQMETVSAEGQVTQQAWQIQSPALTTLQLLTPFRDQLSAEGFDVAFECEASTCGGFDFRYGIAVLPEPEMHVDLGDFRYLFAQRKVGEQPESVSILVSRSAARGFIQISRVGAPIGDSSLKIERRGAATIEGGASSTKAPPSATTAPIALDGTLSDQLIAHGRAILGDLAFQTGSSKLADGQYASLDALATFLKARTDQNIVLVGHSDTDGGLTSNISLSRKRASAVLDRLSSSYGISKKRMQAEGVGYLSPLTTNTTESGRAENRRVEVILSTPN